MKNLKNPHLRTTLTGLTGLAAMTLGITATATTATTATAQPSAPPSTLAKPGAPLNVLFFTADDMGWFTVAAENSPAHTPNVTPNIDKFAEQNMIFTRAHVAIAICQPSRGALTTGKYPHVSGVEGFFHAPGHIDTVMSELRKHGYLVGICGKCEHCNPDANFKWDMWHDAPDLGHGRNPQKYAAYFREFIERCKKAGKPFYFMCNSHDPHRPIDGSNRDLQWRKQNPDYPRPSHVFSPSEVKIPAFLPDIPDMRKEIAQYCSSARRCDDVFGAVMKVLHDEGMADNTIIVFLSDNGMSQPFSKTNAYYNSTRTPLVFHIPGLTKPGQRDDTHFVSGIDYMPTILDALGYQTPSSVNGRSYLPLIRGEEQTGRDMVFTQIYETAGHKRYPMFAAQNADYILIYNPWSDGKYLYGAESTSGIGFKAMKASSDPFIRSRVEMVQHRVPLELYSIKNDPDALHNLAKDPKYAEVVKQMGDFLKGWMEKYDPTPLAAFTAFPSEQQRLAYMKVEFQQQALHKRGKRGAKGGGDEDAYE